ncbi:MAG: hypothetical protein V1789_06020 [PVC group bacterium]
MNKMKIDPVKRAIWEEIARDLSGTRSGVGVLGFDTDFCRFLRREAGLPFPLEAADPAAPAAGGSDGCDLFIGWQVLGRTNAILPPETVYGLLRNGGEALLYGHYRHPRPDDVREWESRIRRRDERANVRLPLPGAVSMQRISGWLASSPFDRYTIRKKGIYYQAVLSKEE